MGLEIDVNWVAMWINVERLRSRNIWLIANFAFDLRLSARQDTANSIVNCPHFLLIMSIGAHSGMSIGKVFPS